MTSIHYGTEKGDSLPQGRIYLIVADESEEFENVLRYTSHRARATGAHIAILYVMGDGEDFVHWSGVEDRVRAEQREQGEKYLYEVASRLHEIDGLQAILFLEHGDRIEAVLKIVNANPAMKLLILGGNTKARTPGPLVTYFSGKGMASLPIPLVIVPDHLTPEQIDSFV